ncbi:MAG: hypothetical protein QOF76_3648 [Solirubrobacteraceae bacterium]|jgi:hypothetical protein|nr:hypothetical protein [Solirubrobacteraceae bacterium]
MDKSAQRFAVWCSLAFPVVFFTGFIVSGLFPPPSPHDSLSEVRHLYGDHPDLLRLGCFIMIASAPLQAPLAGLIGIHMRRIEGKFSVLAFTEMLLGGVAVLAVLIPVMFFVGLGFRPDDRDPQTLLFFHDQAWLFFVGMWSAATMQNFCIGLAILRDRRDTPIMPRWYGYFNLWVATLFVPGGLIYFFKSGAFAWNGVFAFWVPASIFGAWFIVTFVVLKKVVAEQPDDEVVTA